MTVMLANIYNKRNWGTMILFVIYLSFMMYRCSLQPIMLTLFDSFCEQNSRVQTTKKITNTIYIHYRSIVSNATTCK